MLVTPGTVGREDLGTEGLLAEVPFSFTGPLLSQHRLNVLLGGIALSGGGNAGDERGEDEGDGDGFHEVTDCNVRGLPPATGDRFLRDDRCLMDRPK